MPLSKEQLKTEAMKLDPMEREALAEELLLSIDQEGRDAVDAAWLEEVRAREIAFQGGATAARPVDDVLTRLKAKVRK